MLTGAALATPSCRCECQRLHRRSLSLRRRLNSAHLLRFLKTLHTQESSDDLTVLHDPPPVEIGLKAAQMPILGMTHCVSPLLSFPAIITSHAHGRYDSIYKLEKGTNFQIHKFTKNPKTVNDMVRLFVLHFVTFICAFVRLCICVF